MGNKCKGGKLKLSFLQGWTNMSARALILRCHRVHAAARSLLELSCLMPSLLTQGSSFHRVARIADSTVADRRITDLTHQDHAEEFSSLVSIQALAGKQLETRQMSSQ